MHFRRQRDILLMLQERRSRLTLTQRLHSKNAELTAGVIAEELGGLPAKACRTITHDNGGEFTQHKAVQGACVPISAIRTAHGSADRSKMPTAAFVATFPARPA